MWQLDRATGGLAGLGDLLLLLLLKLNLDLLLQKHLLLGRGSRLRRVCWSGQRDGSRWNLCRAQNWYGKEKSECK